MIQDSWETEPSSFAETVQLVENFVKGEIIRETKEKQLYYHTIDHALAVKRRANIIFKAIKPTLSTSQLLIELNRLEYLIGLSAIAHDMVQQFSLSPEIKIPRKRIAGISEIATANKLIEYINNLNQALLDRQLDSDILFTDWDIATIKDAILATICDRDPQAGKTAYSFSPYSIYQPYLYDSQAKNSIVGRIIALADLGTLGIEGVEQYIKEGILVFLEDNLDLKDLILNCDLSSSSVNESTRLRLLNMARFIVNLARERQARFELEIAGFAPQARQILRERVFIYLDKENIHKIQARVPTEDNTSLAELVDFFCLNKNFDV
ncbi:hypothetical protein I4641_08165 [Waterburya agarophytonicola K14]|uniref:HD domain-containing protein n=1 Tax=Waterburya agarophytonicola KI4 TaxID=2874699 RepID=A0A964FGY5_9CYAN|nr:hypothetical protein [Waterburya agarophytonicola]MCC0176953.1 hypothetical protein [Waterburya agarophytonicola KI4]